MPRKLWERDSISKSDKIGDEECEQVGQKGKKDDGGWEIIDFAAHQEIDRQRERNCIFVIQLVTKLVLIPDLLP